MPLLYQIDTTKPDGWRRVDDATSPHSLALAVARRLHSGDYRIHVADGSPSNLHTNGEPMKSERFAVHVP